MRPGIRIEHCINADAVSFLSASLMKKEFRGTQMELKVQPLWGEV